MEHPFRVIKRQFGVKVTAAWPRTQRSCTTLFALSNLWMVRKRLTGAWHECARRALETGANAPQNASGRKRAFSAASRSCQHTQPWSALICQTFLKGIQVKARPELFDVDDHGSSALNKILKGHAGVRRRIWYQAIDLLRERPADLLFARSRNARL